MDETHKNRNLDATAIRKRRSSILKSQRAPRTPLSELEFNVATPTDTTKSRRVSFSRRTGVAEFITNEATTTWKNFYEEHNKSLESSGNDSGVNAPRQVIDHIGKCIFDQQFEEEEAVDFMGNLNSSSGLKVNTSMNFTQQIAALECTGDDRKLSAPALNFEFSTLTDQQSKTFGDDLRIQSLCEISGGINVNFSDVGTIQANDDLDEIQRDLEMAQTNGDPNIPLKSNVNMSDYIEIDLNTTRIRTEDIDMSVTDTIASPKVEDAAKISYIDNKINLRKDWLADKENIAIDPYAAPRESANFAINQESDKVLVFDGKRLTLQSVKDDFQSNHQTIMPNNVLAEQVPKRKTIVLNVNDDLTDIIDDLKVSNNKKRASTIQEHKGNPFCFVRDMGNVSASRVSVSNLIIPGETNFCNIEKTVVYGDNTGNISITQALPANIVYNEKTDKRRTILYEADTADRSVKQAVSSNVMLFNKPEGIIEEPKNTTFFETDYGDISLTQALPVNIILDQVIEKRKTILYGNDTGDLSMTRALSGNIIQEVGNGKITANDNCARNTSVIQGSTTTVVSENNFKDISIVERISNVVSCQDELLPQHRKTILFENHRGNHLGTQAIPIKQILSEPKVNYIDTNNITHPKNIYEPEKTNVPDRIRTVVYEKDFTNITVPQAINSVEENTSTNLKEKEKRKTIIYENDDANISITCAIPSKSILTGKTEIVSKRRQTIVFDDNCDISMTEALPYNLLLESSGVKNKSSIFEQPTPFDTSKTEMADTKQKSFLSQNTCIKDLAHEKILDEANKRRTIENDVDMYITEPIVQIPNREIARRNSSVVPSEVRVLSVTKTTPPELLSSQIDPINKEQDNVLYAEKSIIHSKQDVFVYQAETTHSHSTSKVQSKNIDQEDLKSVKTINNEINSKDQITASISKLVDDDVNEIKSLQVSDDTNEFQVITSNNKELVEQGNLEMSIASVIASGSDSNVIIKEVENKIETNKSILDDLLDMSTTSMEDGLDDKNVMVEIKSQQRIVDNKEIQGKVKESNESMFYILNDSDEEMQTDNIGLDASEKKIENIKVIDETPQLKDKSSLKLEYLEENPKIVHNIQSKLGELKSILNKKSPPKNRLYEKILSSDIDSEITNREKSRNGSMNVSNLRKSIKNADDTNDLLQLLSDFTDNKVSDLIEEDEVNTKPVTVNEHIPLENKSRIHEPKRISFVPKRHSVISREDLLNNISQAQAGLQMSRFELDDSESLEDTVTDSPDTTSSLKKSVRMSNEVVKTLEFKDDTDSETSFKSENVSPLKKTAFGETAYMKECKAKVIPSYLKDVSEEIKELMDDLVKPTADNIPFETSRFDKHLKNTPSTCSTQVQANLITSSQIDVHNELYSNPASTYDIGKQTLANEVAMLGKKEMPDEPESSIKLVRMSASKSLDTEIFSECDFKKNVDQKIFKPEQTVPGRVLVFDHYNPLNNVLLAPLDQSAAHKYNPIISNETLCGSERSDSVQISINEKAFEVERVSVHYNVENQAGQMTRVAHPSGDACSEKNGDTQSVLTNLSKRMSVDQSIDAKMTDVKDIDVNTVIVMKGNKELLDASSSLTLVDDALTRSAFDVDIGTKDEIPEANSPVKVIYQTEKHVNPEEMDVDTISQDDEPVQHRIHCKPKKRNYSPTKRDKHKQLTSNLDITPKPMSKMKKLSNSPNITRNPVDIHHASPERAKLTAERDKKSYIAEKDVEKPIKPKHDIMKMDNSFSENKKRSPSKSKTNKTGTTITVGQLITEFNMDQSCIDENKGKERIITVLNEPKSDTSSVVPNIERRSVIEEVIDLDDSSSFTSSKNLINACEDRNVALESLPMSGSSVFSGTELVNKLSSKNLITECESSANVVSKINMLPFMGSHECEWEISNGDLWSFRLLHARVRLTVHLGHRHGNTARTCVRADTPVKALVVEIAQYDNKNSVASVCVGFAAETIRYLCGRGRSAETAGDVPALVRRCASAARVAVRWARAMRDAWYRLAYTLTDDGLFTLKVANVPLRSVWEITMKLELVVENARDAPWPRANDVHVTSVLSDHPVSEEEVQRAIAHVPHDWGHVPRTVWRIFKYLKHKTREDNPLTV